MLLCSRTLTVCAKPDAVEKGMLSLNPLAFISNPPDVTTSKLIARTRRLEIQDGIDVDEFIVFFR